MHFCKECGNMYYLKLKNIEDNSGNNLVYYCRKCGNEDENILENKITKAKHLLTGRKESAHNKVIMLIYQFYILTVKHKEILSTQQELKNLNKW